ncbi:amino acid ABC transporter permease [Streptomyces violaceorubidus]
MSSVLYDTQGPRAKRRNVLFTVVFLVAFAALLWWVFSTLNDKGQLECTCGSRSSPAPEASSSVHLAGSAEHPEGRGPRGGHRPAARRQHWASPASPTMPGSGFRPRSWSVSSGPSPCWSWSIVGLALFAEYTNVSSDDRPLYAVVTGLVLYNASVLGDEYGPASSPCPRGTGAMAIGLQGSGHAG